MSHAKIRFGTDGWRGVIADDFTFANVRRVAQATADYWNAQAGPKKTIVGYDNRFFSETYARLVCEVLAANGIDTLCAPAAVPTPAISFAVRDQKLCGAVMITASHNPPAFNGYKIKADFAGSATPEICAAIEARVGMSRFAIAAAVASHVETPVSRASRSRVSSEVLPMPRVGVLMARCRAMESCGLRTRRR